MARTSESLTINEILWVQMGNAGDLVLTETTAPSTVATAGQLYVKSSDHLLYFKNSSGVETAVIGGGSGGITIGTTTITSGTTTRILYDNAGVVGEYTLTGTGTVVAMQTSPAFTTPDIGVATGTSLILTNTSATGFEVGANGSTNPTLQVDSSTASAATGLKIKAAAAAGGLAVTVISSGTNEALSIDAKGTGSTSFGVNSTGSTNVGNGTAALTLKGAARTLTLNIATGTTLGTAGMFFNGSTTAANGGFGFGFTYGSTASANQFTAMSIGGTINQTSTAGYTGLQIQPTLTAVGSGGTLLLQVGSTASPSLFTVDGSGHLLAEGVTSTGATGTGKFVFDTSPTLSSPVVGTQATSDNSTKAASTAYVTTAVANAVAGVNPAVAVQAATTANVAGYTYNNGVSGIGATLTQNSAAAVVIDGYTLLLNDRVLFKNQSTAANNGVYLITTLGTGVVPAVFTRALDYDTPSDINNTGAIPVVNGTVNALTSWLLTSSVGTVGTDSLTYTQFSISPSSTVTAVSIATANGFSGSSSGGTTPALTIVAGAITPTTVNGLTISTTTGTFTLTNGKTLSVGNTLTLAGTDSTTMTFPSTTATIARTDAGQTFTGVNVFTSPKIITQISDTNGNILLNIGATASAVNYVKLTNAATGTAGPILSADGETNVDLKIAAKGTGKVHHTTGVYGDVTADTPSAGAVTCNMATSNIHTITLVNGTPTAISVSNVVAGQCFILRLLQDGTGSCTATWFSTLKWAGGSAPTLTTTASKADMVGFVCTSAGNYDGFVVGQNI